MSTTDPVPVNCQELPEDLFTRDPPLFTSSVSDSDRGPTLICVNDIPIPYRSEFYPSDKIQVNFLVVGLVDPGWSKVPYANQNGKTVMGDNPKPLSEWDSSENDEGKIVTNRNKIRCYAYLNKKGKQKDKGPRIDGSDQTLNDGNTVDYTLEPGMVFRCMMKRGGAIGGSDKEKRDNFFPQDIDVIPAFSRVTIKLACKGWDKYMEGDIDANGDEVFKSDLSACYRGYGCGIVEVRLAPGTVSSDRTFLSSSIPSTPEETRRVQNAFCEANWAIRQSFQCENVPFLVKDPSRSSYCAYDHDTESFKVMQWDSNSGDSIDVPKDVMLRSCNATDVDSANQLMDVCLAMSAVRFVCFANEYKGRDKRHSRYTGCPIILASEVMKSVHVRSMAGQAPEDGKPHTFKTGFSIDTDFGQDQLVINVSPSPARVSGDSQVGPVLLLPRCADAHDDPSQSHWSDQTTHHPQDQPCPELPLVCKGASLESAYSVSIAGEKSGTIWSGYFNIAKPVICTKGAGANTLANAENAIKFGRKRWGQPSAAPATVVAPAVEGKAKKTKQ